MHGPCLFRIAGAILAAALPLLGARGLAVAAPDEEPLRLHGRVVDDARRPVAGARVVFRVPGRAAVVVQTDAAGVFRLAAGPLAERCAWEVPGGGLLITQAGEGEGVWRAALGRIAFSPWLRVRRQVGTYALVPAFFVPVRVQDGPHPASGARIHVRGEGGGAGPALLDVQATAEDGTARLGPLPAGRYRLFATAGGYRRGHATFEVQQDAPAPIAVRLTAARDIAIRVVDKTTRMPIPGVRLEPRDPYRNLRRKRLPPLALRPTDGRGRTTLPGAGCHVPIDLLVLAPGYARHRWVVKPDQQDVTIEVRRGTTTIRWPLADPAQAPPEGTLLEILAPWETYAAPPVGRIEQGHVVVPGWLEDSGLGDAAAPDGSVADLSYDMESTGAGGSGKDSYRLLYKPTRFVPPRVLTLRIEEPDGRSAAGRWILVEGPDFLFDADDRPSRSLASFRRTDVEGRVALKAIYTDEVSVKLLADEREHHDVLLGTVPLERIGEEPAVLRIPPARSVRLALTVQGRAALPRDLRVTFDGNTILRMDEDPEEGTLAFRIRHPRIEGSAGIAVYSEGLDSAAVAVSLAASEPLDVAAALVRAYGLGLRVVPPGDFGFVPNSVQVHRWDEAEARWVNQWQAHHGLAPQPPGAEPGTADVGNLRPGRYRAVDGDSGVASAPVEVGPGLARPVLTLQRDRTRRLLGRVEVPQGLSWRDVVIDVDGAAPNLDWHDRAYPAPKPRTPGKDGLLELLVPSGKALVVRARHPLCRSDEVEVAADAAPPLPLRLRRLPTARIDLSDKPDLRYENPGEPRMSGAPYRYRTTAEICHVYARASGERAWRRVPTLFDREGQDVQIAGEPHRRFELRLDLPGWVPASIASVAPSLPRPPTYAVQLDKGTPVHVVFDVPPGARIRWVHASATSTTTPPYVRRARGEHIEPGWNRLSGMYDLVMGGVLLEGLGAGRFEVRASVGFTHAGRSRVLDRRRTVDLDGHTRTTVRFAVR